MEYLVIDDESGEDAVNWDGTPVIVNGSEVIIRDLINGVDEITRIETLGEGRFYLQQVEYKKVDISKIRKIAVSFCMGARLDRLYDLCENQKTITTRKLERYIDIIAEADRLHAVWLLNLVKEIEEASKGEI